jgi:dUTP pyrophosphatase
MPLRGVTEDMLGGKCPDMFHVKLLSPNARLPSKASPESAGFDLTSAQRVSIPPRGMAVVDSGLSVACPKGTYARIAPRSGLAVKNMIDCGAGVIDADYRGSILIVLFNHSRENFEVNIGDRVAQLILERICATPVAVEVDELPETSRGSHGLGSTGVSGCAHILPNSRRGLLSAASAGASVKKAGEHASTSNDNKQSKGKTSCYVGIYKERYKRKYWSKICHGRKTFHLGSYIYEVDAALAYDEAAELLQGPKARQNFATLRDYEKARESEVIRSGNDAVAAISSAEIVNNVQRRLCKTLLSAAPAMRRQNRLTCRKMDSEKDPAGIHKTRLDKSLSHDPVDVVRGKKDGIYCQLCFWASAGEPKPHRYSVQLKRCGDCNVIVCKWCWVHFHDTKELKKEWLRKAIKNYPREENHRRELIY